jgi:predicted ester cyclase
MREVDVDHNKRVVQRLVDDAINRRQMDLVGELFTPEAAIVARRDFESFRDAFPDWKMKLEEIVAEGDTVVARFRCRGTHRGAWRGDAPTEKRMDVDEVYFFRFEGGRIKSMWGLEDTWARKRQLGLR